MEKQSRCEAERQRGLFSMCDYCEKQQCDGECINLTDEELCTVMGFSMDDVKDIKEGERGRQ